MHSVVPMLVLRSFTEISRTIKQNNTKICCAIWHWPRTHRLNSGLIWVKIGREIYKNTYKIVLFSVLERRNYGSACITYVSILDSECSAVTHLVHFSPEMQDKLR